MGDGIADIHRAGWLNTRWMRMTPGRLVIPHPLSPTHPLTRCQCNQRQSKVQLCGPVGVHCVQLPCNCQGGHL